jgi:transcriptional regulator with XRE-family HTH domain
MVSNVGNQIKRIRDKRNMSQERFGKKINLSGKTISAYETQKATPPLYVLERIAKIYSVNIFDIPPNQKHDIKFRMNEITTALTELQSILETGLSL